MVITNTIFSAAPRRRSRLGRGPDRVLALEIHTRLSLCVAFLSDFLSCSGIFRPRLGDQTIMKMACTLCSCLVVDYSKVVDHEIPLPFAVQEVYPGLLHLRKNRDDGCEFCDLLVQLMSEYFDVTESALEKPVRFSLSNARFIVDSAERDMGEDWENSFENGVAFLGLDFDYENAPETRNLFFAVNSNNDCESILCAPSVPARKSKQSRGWARGCCS